MISVDDSALNLRRFARVSPARLDALTGLRIVAAGMILVHHSRMLKMAVPAYAWDHGVSFFFVLSGFILAYAYPKLDSRGEVVNFLGARIARIWPAHIAALLLAIVLLRMSFNRYLPANTVLLHGWVPSWPWYFSYNAPSWSISTEMFFYFAFPFLIYGWTRSWWWKWIVSALLVAFLIWLAGALHLPDLSQKDEITAHGLLYINPLARLFEFTSGMVAYLAFMKLRSASHKVSDMAFTTMEFAVLALAAWFIVRSVALGLLAPYFPPIGMHWLNYACNVVIFPFVVLVFAFGRGLLSRFFATRPMVLLGEISFSVYLVHLTIFSFYVQRFAPDLAAPDYVGLAFCVAATLVLAFAIWAAIEMPCRRAAKRWLKSTLFRPVDDRLLAHAACEQADADLQHGSIDRARRAEP